MLAKFLHFYKLRNELLSDVDTNTCDRIRNNDFKATHVVIGIGYGGDLNILFSAVSHTVTMFGV